MNKLIVAAVATAVSGLASVAAQAAPPSGGGGTTTSSVTVVNSAAAPVPTSVQNVVGVDVLSGPATRARQWGASCNIAVGSYSCDASNAMQAPAGMVIRVIGIRGAIHSGCPTEYEGIATLWGSMSIPGGAAAPMKRTFLTGRMARRATSAMTVLESSGDMVFTSISSVQFGLGSAAGNCGVNYGEITVHYVLEPMA